LAVPKGIAFFYGLEVMLERIIKAIHPEPENVLYLRASVILHWV
jgi:hypothetical protein